MKPAKIGLAFVFVLAFAAAGTPGTYGQTARFSDGDMSAQQLNIIESAFKLKAGGQIDFDAGTMTLAGQSTHMGQFTGEGTFDAATWTFSGTLFDGSGAGVNVSMTLVEQTPGEFTVTMTFLGRLSHSNLVSGLGIGTLHMDQDFMFTTDIEGTLQKCLAKYCLG
jgi:hypothetical protein